MLLILISDNCCVDQRFNLGGTKLPAHSTITHLFYMSARAPTSACSSPNLSCYCSHSSIRLSKYSISYDPISALSEFTQQGASTFIGHTSTSKGDYRTCKMSDNAAVSTNDLPDT